MTRLHPTSSYNWRRPWSPQVGIDIQVEFGRASLDTDLNPDSLTVLAESRLEPSLAEATPGTPVQFERQGYFAPDPDSRPDRLVFNRTVGLRDSWAKIQAKG